MRKKSDFEMIEVSQYWIDNIIHSAKLYVYTPESKNSNGRNIIVNNSLNNTIIDSLTISLTRSEINRLQKLLKRKTTYSEIGADCFKPHHGIVLKDNNEVVIGHFSICFECDNYRSTPSGIYHIPTDEFMKIIVNHKLPITDQEISKVSLTFY